MLDAFKRPRLHMKKVLLLQQFLPRRKKAFFSAPERKLPSLALCIVLDLIGYASFAVPLLGEVIDIVWAPLSALMFMRLFGGTRGFFGGIFNFVEELLPGLDFIPTFTIMWVVQYLRRPKTTYKAIITR